MMSIPIFAQSGIGEVPEWIIMCGLCVWPFHIHGALTGRGSLVGYGIPAVIAQIVILIGLFAAFAFLLRSPRIRWFIKALFLPVGYPLAMLVTNLLPGLIFS